ncbi:MAG: hypothetical protein PHS79_03105 [Patescibacteria group bacterium]|nr:hypothetical protein [Patescibacteria group bacterium]
MGIKITRGAQAGNFPQPPTPKLFRNIAVTFVLVTVAVIAVALWTSSVKAKIIVTAKHEPVSVDTVLDIAANPTSGQIKGRVVDGTFTESREFTVQAVSSTVTSVSVPTKSTGRVKITNNYSKDQPLVVKTRLLTDDGRLYRITKTVNVPSGGSVEVEATSDEVGDKYELPIGTHFSIPGLWKDIQPLIFADAVTSFKGESSAVGDGTRKMVTADALARAQEELQNTALARAKDTLTVEAGADQDWEAIYLVGATQKQSNAAVGQEADSFLAQAKVTVTAVFFPKEDVLAFLRSRLSEKIPEGYTLGDVDLTQASYRLESADPAKGAARLAVSAEAESRLTNSSTVLKKDLIVGLQSDEVIRKWSALDGVEQVDVELHPSWVHRLPSMKDKITVEVN